METIGVGLAGRILKMLVVVMISSLTLLPNAFALTIVQENFENTAVGGIPSGWNVRTGGQSIAVSDTTSFDGAQSLFMQAFPYWGADV
jgi:hypothetical protein